MVGDILGHLIKVDIRGHQGLLLPEKGLTDICKYLNVIHIPTLSFKYVCQNHDFNLT